MPPWQLAHKALRKVRRIRRNTLQRATDHRQSSYDTGTFPVSAELHRFFEPLPLELLIPHEEQIRSLTDLYLTHHFDLLGSGWVQVKPGMQCRGMEGHLYPFQAPVDEIESKNDKESRERRQLLSRLDPTYDSIDWHRDFKSGYRWDPRTWSQDISYGHHPGVDIKVPWELARMQHLVQLSWAYALSQGKRPGFQKPERYLSECQNQILDFMAANPPRFGVNWTCTMDVAIRIANWLVAYDLLKAHGAVFDQEFDKFFINSVYDHASHIRQNLEWAPDFRGNHYLADIVGLMYAAAYLPEIRETTSWFSFAAKELAKETPLQFHSEGSNCEASTCYHRLASEMCIYGTALALRKGITFSENHLRLIAAMSQFTIDLTKPDGRVPQIGDNDNGRFFKFFPVFHKNSQAQWQEDHLDHRHLPAACAGLLAPYSRVTRHGEAALVRLLSGHRMSAGAMKNKDRNRERNIGVWESLRDQCLSVNPSRTKRFSYPVTGPGFLAELKIQAYPQFGVYIFRSKRLYFAVRCGWIGRKGFGAHAHNDQLSFELQIDGTDICRDPGTFVYTALPHLRNHYRSVKAHCGPQGDRETGRLDMGLFILSDQSRAQCLYWGDKGFIGRHRGFGSWVTRLVELSPTGVAILDAYEDQRVADAASMPEPLPFSPGYGIRMTSSDVDL